MNKNERTSRSRSAKSGDVTSTEEQTRERKEGKQAMVIDDARRKEFEALAFEHLDGATRFARRLTRDESEAQDLVQDSYLRAYRFFDQYTLGTNFKAWLFRILRNTFINEYRKKKRRPIHLELTGFEAAADAEGEAPSLGGHEMSPDFGDVLLRDQIGAALARTPKAFRDVVVACLVNGQSYREVAEALDIPLGTVMSRLYRGRRHLQEALATEACESGLAEAC